MGPRKTNREESAAGRSTGRAPEREHINPCPWSEGDGKKTLSCWAASIGLEVASNRLEGRRTFSLLRATPAGRGLSPVTSRTRTSKLSNSNGAIGTSDRFEFLVARIIIFIALDCSVTGIGDARGPLPLGQVVSRPGANGRPIGAGIKCDSDEVLEVQDRGAALTQPKMDCGR